MKVLITGFGVDKRYNCYYYTTPGTRVTLPFAKTHGQLMKYLNGFKHEFL